MRIPVFPVIGLFVGCSLVLALLVMRGFVLHEHARIMLGALAVVWLVGVAWTLATAAEQSGGWRQVGFAAVLLIFVATLIAALVPVAILMFWVPAQLR